MVPRADDLGGHAFISYVREDKATVDRLQRILEAAGISVWRDTADLWPGEDWRAKIREAITEDALVFLACFSDRSLTRMKSFQNEEVLLAIDQFRIRRPDRPWLIPLRLSDCELPAFELGAGRTFDSLQRVDLFDDHWEEGVARLIASVLKVVDIPRLPDHLSAAVVLPSQTLGITRISLDGQAGPSMSRNLASAKSIAIMSTSALRVIEIQQPYLVDAVRSGCQLRVLVAEAGGELLRDVEESEARHGGRGPISNEIRDVEDRLREVEGEARTSLLISGGIQELGSVQIGFYTTHLRSTMIICDDTWGWLTLTLPPARAPETPSFELGKGGQRPVIVACLKHFNRTWDIVQQRGATRRIGGA